ncbi:hypothetical protein Q7P37_004091 [Cladosporium fusiforme]
MVKSHLPAHMDSVRQKLRPKHQLLVLKCYPRLPRNSAADVNPNGSELSYLLYYASTRRSKLQKVGTFLERKTANDVYKAQSARVFVTLQILTALLENKTVGSTNSFSLIAPYVLRTVSGLLQNTNDISLIEASLRTWESLCKHQDPATLAADHEYQELYEQVVRQWSEFAHRSASKKIGKSTVPVTVPDAVRLREAGLGAINAILASDALASEVGRQLGVTIPAVLSNIRGEDAIYLAHLQAVGHRNEEEEREKALQRRQSLNTVRTDPGTASFDSDARAAEGTVQDADKLAEEGVAVMALNCLKSIFESDDRAQVRSATNEVLKYLVRYQENNRPETSNSRQAPAVHDWTSWAVKLFEIITGCTAVQDRYIVLVTAAEILAHLPLQDSDIAQHLLLTHLIDDILRSDLNLIGLSVMDILLGLVQHILRVLQLSGPPATARTSTSDVSSKDDPKDRQPASAVPSAPRLELLTRLKSCIADLATHIYYTDQVGDMTSAILLRLKPNTSPTAEQSPTATAAAIEEPMSAVSQSATNISTTARERSHSQSGGFFTFDTARQVALELARDVMIVANSSRTRASGGVAESRNTVPLSTWEGTQWLLRDPSPNVRRAYVDALCTWLCLETRKADSKIQEPQELRKRAKSADPNGTLARRALSNASNRNRQSKKVRNTFLQLLNLAVYENALQYSASSETDILLLHLLSTTLVQNLGVNAVQSSMPMIFALQEEIPKIDQPVAKIRLGSLVHGYLLQLCEQFDSEPEVLGDEVRNEIARRKHHGVWMEAISIPAAQLERIPSHANAKSSVPELSPENVAHEDLKPLDNRQALVDRIGNAYSTVFVSPPSSPPTSPGRSFSVSAIDRSTSYLSAKSSVPILSLPEKAKDAMLAIWTKEACLAAVAAAAPKSISLSGTQSLPRNGNHRQLLGAANPVSSRNSSNPQIDSGAASAAQLNGTSPIANHRQQTLGPMARRLDSRSPDGRPSTHDRRSSSAAGGNRALRVEELKRVLAGGGVTAATIAGRSDPGEDTASESMVEVEEGDLGSESEFGHSTERRKVSRKASKTDLSALLEGIDMDEVEQESQGRKVGFGRPPY